MKILRCIIIASMMMFAYDCKRHPYKNVYFKSL